MKQPKLTRRGFIKATALTGLLGTASTGLLSQSVAHAQSTPATKIVRTNCRNCTADCGVLAHVRDGRVIKLEGNPDFKRSEGALCAKGLSGIQALYNPNRLKYPMERAGERGENKWKRISWEEAIDKIARKLMEIRAKYGAEAVMASTGGGGNPNFFSTGRFCNVFGTPNWFEPGCAQCYLPRVLIYDMMYGGGFNGNPSLGDSNGLEAYFYNDIHMKSYVLWGTAPSYHGPSQAGRAMVELRARGVKTVVIDPRFTPDAAKADVWLPVRPGTDVALALSWIKYIIDKKLYDTDFVMKWTNLPFLVDTKTKMFLRESDLIKGGDAEKFVVWDTRTKSAKPMAYPWDDALAPALEGTFTVNNTQYKTGFQLLKERAEPWTLKKAGEVCWLDPVDIEKGIRIYATNSPSNITIGVATDQGINSTQAPQATAALDMLMGNIEKPGAVLQRYNTGVLKDFAVDGGSSPLLKFLPNSQLKKRISVSEHKGILRWSSVPASQIIENLSSGKPYKLRAWLERSGNKFATVADAGRWEKAIKEMELVVHMYMYPTSFSTYADFLLPTSEWLECSNIVPSFNRMYPRMAATHLWESANEVWIWSQIAKRCGELGHEACKASFDPKATAPEIPNYSTHAEHLDGWASRLGMTWNEFISKPYVELNPMDKWKQYYLYKKIDPVTKKPVGFGTPSKKCEVYLESLITLGRTGMPLSPVPLPPASVDYDPLPYYLEPTESPNTPMAKDYPLSITSGRLPYWHHGTLRNVPQLREIAPVAEVWINPVDAKKYGISQGDWVWLESLRGKIQAKALLTEGIGVGVLYMERFWNPETLNTSTRGWKEMNINVLTKSSPPYNDVCGTYTLRGFQVKIFKAQEAPVGIWQKPEDFKPWLPQSAEPTKIVELKS